MPGIETRRLSGAELQAQLDALAVTGGDAARLYARMGWTTVGVIPDFALYPDGRPCATTFFFKKL